jgi:hypothetical protein
MVNESRIASGLRGGRYPGRIRRYARDPMSSQQLLSVRAEPALVPRLARDRARVQSAQGREERLAVVDVERERRRKLHEEGAKPRAQPLRLLEKDLEQHVGGHERLIMGDRAREFDGEAKVRRHRGRPALVDGSPVLAVE